MRAVKVGVGVVLVVVLLIVVMKKNTPQRYESSNVSSNKSYYTADEGKTDEAGPWDLVPPYEKDGKTFVRMYKFQDGKDVKIGYFEKYTDEARAVLMAEEEGRVRMVKIGQLGYGVRLVKRPGDETWVFRNTDEGQAIAEVMTSEGRGRAQPVFPK